jgi:hypothetical protein
VVDGDLPVDEYVGDAFGRCQLVGEGIAGTPRIRSAIEPCD